MLKKYFPVLFLLILSSWILLYYNNGLISLGDFIFPVKPQVSLYSRLYAWKDFLFLGVSSPLDFVNIVHYFPIFLLYKSGLPINAIQAAFFFFIFFTSSFSIYILISEILGSCRFNKFISVISANLYIFNPYILGIKLRGYNMSLYSYAFAPLILYLFYKYIKTSSCFNNKYLYLLGISFILSNPGNTQPAYTSWFILIVVYYLLFLIFFNKFNKVVVCKFLISTLLFFLINSFWIIPSFNSGFFSSTFDVVKSLTNIDSIKVDSARSLTELLRFLGMTGWTASWRDVPYTSYSKIFYSSTFIIISFVLLFIALSFFFFKKVEMSDKKNGFWRRYFFTMYLLSVFFIGGTVILFPDIKLWLFTKSSFLLAYRKPYEKFGFFLLFSFVGLFAFSIKNITSWIEDSLFNKYREKIIVGFLAFILILINIYSFPFWTKQVIPFMNFPECQLSGINHYPDYYYEMGEYLQRNKIAGRLLGLPVNNSPISSGVENYKWGYAGFDPIYSFVNTGYILLNPLLPFYNNFYNGINSITSNLVDYKKNLVNFNTLFNIKKNILRNDICWQLYNSPNPKKDKKYLEGFGGKRLSLGEIDIIDTSKEYFVPHLYSSKSILISSQSVNSLPEIISQPDYKLRSAIFFENQNQTKSESLKVIKFLKSEAEQGVATEAAKIAEEAAQCVTGDTILRRRRKKSKVKSQKSKVTGGFDPEDFEDVRIDEIEEGDEILTLDEETGRFVTQKVKKLMGLGVKPIIKLTTSSGKTIRTTAQHPYLTLTDTNQAFAFIDEVGVGKAPDQPFFGVAVLYTNDSLALNRKLHDIFTGAVSAYNTNKSRFEFKFNAVTGNNLRFFKAIVNTLAEDDSWSFAAILSEKKRHWNYWNAYLNYLKKLIIGAPFAKLTVVADYLAKPETAQKSFKSITRLDKVAHLLQLESQGSLLLQVSDILLGALHFEERQKEMGLTSGKEAKVLLARMVKTLLSKKITAIECLHAVTNNLPQILPAVKNDRQRWVKVKDLSEGAVIATKDGWEKIVKIKPLSAKPVYDIEVEGTHNFVGNGIVAHNTYVNGNLELRTNLPAQAGNSELPVLEFKKINPTKYRVRVHGAKGTFPVVFSESFHDGWKLYVEKVNGLTGLRVYPERSRRIDGLKDYKILDGNEEDQASEEELSSFIDKGWVTTLGDGNPKKKFGIFSGAGEKEIKHMKYENGKERLDYVEKYRIDFVSKNFQDTIQNDNLPKGPIWETWLARKLKGSRVNELTSLNKNVIQIPDDNHLMVNGYANSWIIDPNEICSSNPELPTSNYCIQNPDGTYDMELVIEFWPQRLFYIGLGISGLTLMFCLSYLIYDWRKRRTPSIHLRVY